MRRDLQSGQIVLLALLTVVLITGSLLLLAASVGSRMQLVRREGDVIRLTALTDAALAETLAHLSRSPGYGGLPERPFGDGRIASDVEAAGGTGREVIARAEYRQRRRTVRARVQLTVLGPVVLDWEVISSREEEGSARSPTAGRR